MTSRPRCARRSSSFSPARSPPRHNILLAPGRVLFIDWPHARLGAPIIDLLTLLSSAAADGLDPEPFFRRQTLAAQAGPHAIDAVLAAQAGFCLADALDSPPPGLERVYTARLDLGRPRSAGFSAAYPVPRAPTAGRDYGLVRLFLM
jgi:hypothetical protein